MTTAVSGHRLCAVFAVVNAFYGVSRPHVTCEMAVLYVYSLTGKKVLNGGPD